MGNVRGTAAGLAVLTVIALGSTGCAQSGGTQTPAAAKSSAAAADPKQVLAASTAELQKGNYTFTGSTHEQTMKGSMHLPSKSMAAAATITGKDAGQMDMRYVEPDSYLKMKLDLSELKDMPDPAEFGDNPEMKKLAETMQQMKVMFSGKKWLHVDKSRFQKEGNYLPLGVDTPDITGASHLLAGVTTATRVSDTAYTGTLDATKGKALENPLDTDAVKALGDKVKSLPFEATLDAQGRLVKLVVNLPAAGAIPAHAYVTEVTGYGNATAQTKPAASEVMEMPEETYKMLDKK